MKQQNSKSSAGPAAGHNPIAGDDCSALIKEQAPFILVVTRNGHMAEVVMNYAINVADRLKYKILAVHINTLPFFHDGGRRSDLFAAAMRESAQLFREKAGARGVLVECMAESGKIGKVVQRWCHSEKRIEFVVIDKGIRMEEVAAKAPVPVFSVIYSQAGTDHSPKVNPYTTLHKGEISMSTTSKKRHVKNCLVFGALTAGLYAAVFANQDVVMTYFTKGGVYSLMPVAVVFAVSYFHGNFTSAFWSALGIEGSKATATKPAEIRPAIADTVDVRRDTRPRVQVNV